MLRTIGLMSGTSLDGVDAAYLETDGEAIARFGPRQTLPYEPALRRALRALLDRAESLTPDDPALLDATRRLTERHAEAVEAIGLPADLVGFHGQTILHRPAALGRTGTPFTWQIGDAALLARRTGMSVAYDFRSADVAAGGQGAPLAPGYHRARSEELGRPLGVLNLGGVGNLTWFAVDGTWGSFDTGPGNALIDDWVLAHTGRSYDEDGKVAASGMVHDNVLQTLCDNPWFDAAPPKSLDRNAWDIGALRGLSPGDGAATLTAFTAETVRLALTHVPPIGRLLVTGGGRLNPVLMAELAQRCAVPCDAVEAVGWNGDALEAEAFAWLAVRVLDGKPLSWPETTGVPVAMTGGRVA